jgi:hypothetical protein
MQETTSLTLEDDEKLFTYTIVNAGDGLIELTYRDSSNETSIYIQHEHLSLVVNALTKML